MAKKKSKEQAPENIKRERFQQSLRCQLTKDEIAERANRAGHKHASIYTKEAELKAVVKHHKGIIETEEAELALLLREVRDESTYRQIECERQFDFNEKMYREVRIDTGEIINERKLLPSEAQMELPFNDSADERHDSDKMPPKNGTDWKIPPVVDGQDETWKAVLIVEALPTLGKKIFDGMAKINLQTMGELMAWKFGTVERWWTDLDGVGEAACTKIDDAIAAFFEKRNSK